MAKCYLQRRVDGMISVTEVSATGVTLEVLSPEDVEKLNITTPIFEWPIKEEEASQSL